MKKIYWDDGLSVGVKKLDEDHKHLIDLVNQLISTIEENADVETIHQIVDRLEAFTVRHNHREEALIAKCDPAFLSGHRSGHDELFTSIADFRSLLSDQGPDKAEAMIDMVEFFVRWVLDHIIDQDLNLEPLFRSHGLNNTGIDVEEDSSNPLFQRISFIRGLEVLVAVSLLPMLIFSIMLNMQVWGKVDDARSVIALAGFSQVAGNLIHELQKERGATSGLLASGRLQFAVEIVDQRALTDKQLEHFQERSLNLSDKSLYPEVADVAKSVQLELRSLSRHRQRIDTGELGVDEAAYFYTKVIALLLDVSQRTSALTTDPDVQKRLTAYSLLIAFKEAAGQERAMGAIAFARKGLTERQYLSFVGLVARQDALWEQMRDYLSEAEWAEWLSRLDNMNGVQHSRYREFVLQSGIRALSVDIPSTEWFDVATQRINQMHDFESWLVLSMLSEARQKVNLNSALFVMAVFGSWVVVAVIGYFALQLTSSIRLPILSLTKAMKALMANNKTVRVPYLGRGDELGDMVRSYESFRRKLIRTDMLSKHQELGRLVATRHALELRRTTEMGEKYRRLAAIDRLTGVLNRGEFYARSKKEISRSRRHGSQLSLMILDLDFFKRINDTYGHAAGDEVLKCFAEETANLLREPDLFGRIGGEEFAVLLIESDLASAGVTAERIRRRISSLVLNIEGHQLRISVSIGVSECNPGEEEISSAMKRADKALYHAKEAGRDRVSCFPIDLPKSEIAFT